MPLQILSSVELGSAISNQTSTVCEPSLSINDKTIFFTGNWFASKSLDAGKTWTYLSPYTQLPKPGVDFCCDQTVIYDPSRKLTFWILQYSEDASGENVLRVAVNKSKTLAEKDWYWWDIKPAADAKWAKQWFDYNHAALSSNFLYVGTNVFKGGTFTRGVIFRLSLDELANSKSNLKLQHFETTKNFSLRCTQGATDTMYFGSFNSDKELNLFEWKEKSAAVNEYKVPITVFSNTGTYTANCPDGRNWLKRCDERITGAWVSKGVIGFMWTANKQAGRPYPFIRCVRIDAKKFTRLDEPDIWSPNTAYAYPDGSPNKGGTIGISLFCGGGATLYPSHAIGVFDDVTKKWTVQIHRSGTHSAGDFKWGDYVACRKHSPDDSTWVASGFILKGGSTRNFIQPLFTHFKI